MRNDGTFVFQIICEAANSQCYFVHQHLNKCHWLTGRAYLAVIASNAKENNFSSNSS